MKRKKKQEPTMEERILEYENLTKRANRFETISMLTDPHFVGYGLQQRLFRALKEEVEDRGFLS